MSQLFVLGGQSIGVSASATVLPVNIQISFRMDWLDLLAVQGTLKSLLQHHDLKASIFRTQPCLWSATSLHDYWKVKSLSRVQLFATPWTVACQSPPSMEFSRQEYGGGCHFLLQGIFLTQGLNPVSYRRQTLYRLSHKGIPTGKSVTFTTGTFVGRMVSLLFNMPSRFVITFLSRNSPGKNAGLGCHFLLQGIFPI